MERRVDIIEVEAFRAVDRERLLGNLNDAETAISRGLTVRGVGADDHD